MVSFHLPLPPDLHEELREEAERSGQPATVLARDALRIVLAHRRRQRQHAEIAEFAAEHAGSALDLDEERVEVQVEMRVLGIETSCDETFVAGGPRGRPPRAPRTLRGRLIRLPLRVLPSRR